MINRFQNFNNNMKNNNYINKIKIYHDWRN